MLSYTDFLARQEHDKELLREAERERLIRSAGLRQPGNWRPHRKVAGWIGAQMVSCGATAQHHQPVIRKLPGAREKSEAVNTPVLRIEHINNKEGKDAR
jgi:hypothetical protein